MLRIVSIITNNPIFIELQLLTLKHFCKESFEYIVFNDGKDFPDITNYHDPDNHGRTTITKKCNELSVTCHDLPNAHHQNIHSASRRHADSLKHILKYIKDHKGEYLILDGDMFLVAPLSLDKYRNYHAAFVLQSRPDHNLTYMWPNFFYMDTSRVDHLDALSFDLVPGGDSGSASKKWLECYDDKTVPRPEQLKDSKKSMSDKYFYYIYHLSSGRWTSEDIPSLVKHHASSLVEFIRKDKRNTNGFCFSEIYDETFFHYRAGSNWMNNGKKENPDFEVLKQIVLTFSSS